MLAVGFLLGGIVGVGTVLYALAIGPLLQLFLPWVVVRLPAQPPIEELTPADGRCTAS